MDGSSSAPDSDSESFERTTPSRSSDAERELQDLRARAYGPNSDIEADPAAIARLIDLEAAHVRAAMPVDGTELVGSPASGSAPSALPAHEPVAAVPAVPQPRPTIPSTSTSTSTEGVGQSLWRRVALTRSRVWFAVGSIVVAALLISTGTWLLVRNPDATLQPAPVDADNMLDADNMVVRTMIAQGGDPDLSTVRRFERYHDINVWSVDSRRGETCLIGWDEKGSGRYQFQCVPAGIELALHMGVEADASDGFGEWLSDGSVISFHLRENSVDVFVHPPPGQ